MSEGESDRLTADLENDSKYWFHDRWLYFTDGVVEMKFRLYQNDRHCGPVTQGLLWIIVFHSAVNIVKSESRLPTHMFLNMTDDGAFDALQRTGHVHYCRGITIAFSATLALIMVVGRAKIVQKECWQYLAVLYVVLVGSLLETQAFFLFKGLAGLAALCSESSSFASGVAYKLTVVYTNSMHSTGLTRGLVFAGVIWAFGLRVPFAIATCFAYFVILLTGLVATCTSELTRNSCSTSFSGPTVGVGDSDGDDSLLTFLLWPLCYAILMAVVCRLVWLKEGLVQYSTSLLACFAIAFRCFSLRFVALRCVALLCVALRFVALLCFFFWLCFASLFCIVRAVATAVGYNLGMVAD